jgi:hypothetical protein
MWCGHLKRLSLHCLSPHRFAVKQCASPNYLFSNLWIADFGRPWSSGWLSAAGMAAPGPRWTPPPDRTCAASSRGFVRWQIPVLHSGLVANQRPSRWTCGRAQSWKICCTLQVFLENLIVVSPVKKLPALYWVWRFIIVFTKTRQWTQFWARRIQFRVSLLISRYSLILSPRPCLGLRKLSVQVSTNFYACRILLCMLHVRTSHSLDVEALIIFGQ